MVEFAESITVYPKHSPLVEKFLKTVPGKVSDLWDVDCYLSATGDIKQIMNIDVILKSLINLLLTMRGTYIDNPEYGCDLIKYIFEPADELTLRDVKSELQMAIAKYEDRAEITNEVKFFSNRKGFLVNIFISYRGEKKKASLTIDESILKVIGKA